MHSRHWASIWLDHPATLFTRDGSSRSYGALEEIANRGAHLFRALDHATGDGIAIWCDNWPAYLEIC